MPKGMKPGERSFRVETSFPVNVPGGRYVSREPMDAAQKAARIRMEKANHQRSTILIKLVETSRYDKTGRGPFYYKVQSYKKENPVTHTFEDGSTFSSEYDYETKALTDEEIDLFEEGKFNKVL